MKKRVVSDVLCIKKHYRTKGGSFITKLPFLGVFRFASGFVFWDVAFEAGDLFKNRLPKKIERGADAVVCPAPLPFYF